MPKIIKKSQFRRRNQRPTGKKRDTEDLMDPILYNGGLDKEKYPQLPLENDSKIEEEIENPLNQR